LAVYIIVECPFSVSFVAARFEVLRAVVLKFQVFRIGARCQLVNSYRHCEGPASFHLSVDMSVNIYQSTHHNFPADLNLQMEHMCGTTFEAANQICRMKLRSELDAIC